MGRAIAVIGAALLLGLAGCGEAADDTAETVRRDAPPATTAAEEPETTTTSRPRPTTTTTTTTTSTTTTTTPPTTTTTTAPPTTTTAPPPPVTEAEAPVGGGCAPGYDPCVPVASDVDCSGGSGDGPAYVDGPIQVSGSDPYGLDHDSDGVGCES